MGIPSILSAENTLEESFGGKCKAFRDVLFPTPPHAEEAEWDTYQPGSWTWPSLTISELESACSAAIKGTTPGPDGIPHQIISQAYAAIPNVFFHLYSSLFEVGYHPQCWKQATGIILRKPAKPDYSQPKAYRVISLLNCLGKVMERILAKRLGYLAETSDLLHQSQIGDRLKKSAIDAALLLTNEVETNRQLNMITSTLFMDVKGAFDHVARNQLLVIMQKKKLPINLIAWTASFLEQRTLQLEFDGERESFSEIKTGIPQGSPVSPILFLIYIQGLFTSNTVKIISYMDDITLTTASSSLNKNIKILEREASKVINLGLKDAVQFDLTKTELMHFTGIKKAQEMSITLPDGKTVQPSQSIKWLGIWFDPGLKFRKHIKIRTSQATQSFFRMARLANTEKGLSPAALRQIYLACVISIADYGSVIWWKGQNYIADALQKIQNLALRKILGVFKSAPILPMEVEAALAPPRVRLHKNIQRFALRLSKLSKFHPVNMGLNRHIDLQKPTQLSRINNSIANLIDFDGIEQIKQFTFKPWRQVLPYTTTIERIPKDEAAERHQSLLQQTDWTSTTFIYTDASLMAESTGVGLGFVATGSCSRTQHQFQTNIGPGVLVYNGELEAIVLAMEYASQHALPGHSYQVFSDNQAALHRLKQPSDNPGQACQLRALAAGKIIQGKNSTINLNWIPGHLSIEGNEMADRLAKAASCLPPEREETSFAMAGTLIHHSFQNQWLNYLKNKQKQFISSHSSYEKKFD